MSITLAQALQGVDLQKGRIYRCEVKGMQVELRVLDQQGETEAPSIPESDIMLDAWVELPEPGPGVSMRSELGEPDLPDIPEIPRDEEVS